MLQRKHDIEDNKNNKPLWTQNESIEFECAKETIGHIIAICSSLIAEEEEKERPNVNRIAELNAKQFALADERSALHWHHHDKIAKINREYGAKIRVYEAGGECPV